MVFVMSKHRRVKTELGQRLLKFEALHGLYLVPLSLAGMYVALFHLEYVLHALAAVVFTYGLVEGLRKLFYNPVKKAALEELAKQKYMANNSMGATCVQSSQSPRH
jgi:hypothetical protein